MTKLARKSRCFIFLSILVLSACNSLSTTNTLPSIQGLSSTLAVQTMVANPYLIFLVQTPTPTFPIYTPTQHSSSSSLATMPAATSTPSPSVTLVPSLTPIETLSNSSGSSTMSGECINAAEFVQDVSIPDDTLVKPGKKFTKIWRLRNIGSCTWTSNYMLVFVAGDLMKGLSPKNLDTTTEPGQTMDLAIDLVAPDDFNYYQGNWMLQDVHGNNFGTGSDAGNPFWVSIKVYLPGWRDIFGGSNGGGGGGCFGGG